LALVFGIALLFALSMLIKPVAAAPGVPNQPGALLDAAGISKSVMPVGAVPYGSTVTYTVLITPAASTIQLGAIYFRDELDPALVWGGFVGAHAGFAWSPSLYAITSTALFSTSAPIALVFTAKVKPTGQAGSTATILNVAGLCNDPGQSIGLCPDTSNVVQNTARIPYMIYLPLITRNFAP
jgi:hypothetical protein